MLFLYKRGHWMWVCLFCVWRCIWHHQCLLAKLFFHPSTSLTPVSTRLGSLTLLRLPPLRPSTVAAAPLLQRVHPKDPGVLSWFWCKSMKKGVWWCEFLFCIKDNRVKDKSLDLFCYGKSTGKVMSWCNFARGCVWCLVVVIFLRGWCLAVWFQLIHWCLESWGSSVTHLSVTLINSTFIIASKILKFAMRKEKPPNFW